MHLNKPKLRWPIDVRTQEIEGQHVVIISCPIGVAKEPLVLVSGVAPILGRFQGQETMEEIASSLAPYGATPAIILELAQLLDEHLFLESPKFFEAEKENKRSFIESTFREPALAGFSYALDPKVLGSEIDQYLALGSSLEATPNKPMRCLVAPHIDYRRGGSSYGKAYSTLKNEKHDLYILIGTSHQRSSLIFHLTKKDFGSPLGTLRCDRDFIDDIAIEHGVERSFKDELLHKQEHSLELQIPFLKRQIQDSLIAPILVGSFYLILQAKQKPQQNSEYESFVEALCRAIDKKTNSRSSICFIAGVDMAHVGQEFGDQENLSDKHMQMIAHRDQVYIDSIVNQDKELMFNHIAEDGDARRICGFPTMYTILDVFDRLGINCSSKVFDYNQAVNSSKDCGVTFSSIGMYAN